MSASQVSEYAQQALMLTLLLGAPLLLAAAAVGLLVGLFQALTQVQDQTLPYAFKAVVVFGLVALLGGWLGTTLMRFAEQMLVAVGGIR